MNSSRRRALKRPAVLAAGIGVATALGLGSVLAAAGAASAATDASQQNVCPPGTIPGATNSHASTWTDNGVAVYAGRDFTSGANAAEVEGLLVVGRNATIGREAGVFNIGTAGVGSGVWPSAGSVMLAVGGNLAIGNPGTAHIDVGAGATDGGSPATTGGDVRVGGSTAPTYAGPGDVTPYFMNGGTLTEKQGVAATAPWAGWGDTLTALSADFGARAATGTAAAGSVLTLTSTNAAADPQVFTVSGATLAATSEVHFVGIPAGAQSVIVNVVGAAPVAWAPTYFSDDGVRADDFASPLYGKLAQRTIWNFADATDVTLGGTSQILGSVLVPHVNPADPAPTLTITASTNGRIMTNGSIVMDGVGNELHNYPFNTGVLSCTVQPATPAQPEVPVRPETPEVPVQPETPEVPGGAVVPNQPAAPVDTPAAATTAPAAAAESASLASTGGTVAVWLVPAGIALLVGGGFALWLTARRRKA
ncbi:choice-of-anchor A family protein [Microbacterium candidum]|uniref:Choice-of-anchor A family protein n=1 Tax=Microbacterium candidum TaxID=3041922 RepID=A0ABT7MXD2_9MICO|nr:choice-of-anchor A family protein [Microbacterium sp. ASV49]MDL9979114.1 choice-of-anchor A family protein [Microbacterium sp. ASV49]